MARLYAGLWGAVVGSIAGAGLVSPHLLAISMFNGSQDANHMDATMGWMAVAGAILAGTVACSAQTVVTDRAFQAGAFKGAAQALVVVSAPLFLFSYISSIASSGAPYNPWPLFAILLASVAPAPVVFGGIIGAVRGWRGRAR